MDVSSLSATSATIPVRLGAASLSSLQATSAVPDPIPSNLGSQSSRTNTPDPSPANTQTPPAGERRDFTSQDRLAQAEKQANDSFALRGKNLYASFEKDKTTGINVVKIVDKKTHETISQMPAKEMVEFAQFLENPQGLRGKLLHATA